VLVIQTNAALQSHFMKNVMDFLTYNESPAVFDTYTTCQSEHGIADDAGSRHATLAVESRMSPVFVHDPRKGDTLAERFSLDGNPEIGKDWVTTTLEYVDDDGNAQLKEMPFTAADFARHEGRFKKHFSKLNGAGEPVPVVEYIDLKLADRHDKIPFVWSTDANKKLTDLTEERRRNWRMLEYLSGLHIDRLNETHRRELEELQQKYQESNTARESSIDSIARGMAELASASGVPATPTVPLSAVTAAQTATQVAAPVSTGGGPLVEITDDDMPKCTNCKTCYQDLSELFEKTKIMVDGSPKEVSRVIPGVFDKIEITQELIQRASRVADDCDAEIIGFHQPE
jgi:pyruvate-ferredoxin/flavodoxin oxidoreductase